MKPYPRNAPPPNPAKPWRVTAYRTASWGGVVECFVVGDYRWYWQANVMSWTYNFVFGYGCNTWKAKP